MTQNGRSEITRSISRENVELVMKLSKKETEILLELDSYQKKRRKASWTNVATLFAIWAILTYLDRLSDQMFGILMGISIVALIQALRVESQVSPEDKLLQLLRRYLNRDAEALMQISSARAPEKNSPIR
ncbi:MAG: hypothetical protein OER85_17840 [Gammaproteobacteria bacterium]|nr:hypothetical protein [Gammaproteobacteria bacterium]